MGNNLRCGDTIMGGARLTLLVSSVLLAACNNASASAYSPTPLNPLTEIKAQLAFTCAH